MSHLHFNNVPKWIKITKSYTDFATAALTNDISILTLPIGGVIHDIIINSTTTFSGGAIGSYIMSIGIAGNLTRYTASAANLYTGATPTASIGTATGVVPNSFVATTDVRASVTSAIGNLDAASQGSVDIYMLISVLP